MHFAVFPCNSSFQNFKNIWNSSDLEWNFIENKLCSILWNFNLVFLSCCKSLEFTILSPSHHIFNGYKKNITVCNHCTGLKSLTQLLLKSICLILSLCSFDRLKGYISRESCDSRVAAPCFKYSISSTTSFL